MISDEAVEAAAKATFVHANLGSSWEDAQPDWQNAYRASVLAGLEAAAPYLKADAWDEGYGQSQSDTWWGKGDMSAEANPYRSQA